MAWDIESIFRDILEAADGDVQPVAVDSNGDGYIDQVLWGADFDHDGVVEVAKADADGKVRLSYTKGLPFVQLRGVKLDGKLLPAIGEDITADADREDIRKGDVEYFVLQKDSRKNVVYVFDAD